MILNEEDAEYIEKAYNIINKSYFPNSNKVTDVYNRVFADRENFRKLNYTTCGTCIRDRVLELKKYKDIWQDQKEAHKEKTF